MANTFPSRFAWYPAAIAAAGLLLHFTAPVLSPFLFSAILAYICLLLGTLAGFNQFERVPGLVGAQPALRSGAILLVGLRETQKRYLQSELHKS